MFTRACRSPGMFLMLAWNYALNLVVLFTVMPMYYRFGPSVTFAQYAIVSAFAIAIFYTIVPEVRVRLDLRLPFYLFIYFRNEPPGDQPISEQLYTGPD
jgi:hypothetical protein